MILTNLLQIAKAKRNHNVLFWNKTDIKNKFKERLR